MLRDVMFLIAGKCAMLILSGYNKAVQKCCAEYGDKTDRTEARCFNPCPDMLCLLSIAKQ